MELYKLITHTAYPVLPDLIDHKTSSLLLWNDSRYNFGIWEKRGAEIREVDMGFVVKACPSVGVLFSSANALEEIPSCSKKYHINECGGTILVKNLHDFAEMIDRKPDGFYLYISYKWSDVGVAACRITDMSDDLSETLAFSVSHSHYADPTPCAANISAVQSDFDLATTLLQGNPRDVGPDEYPARLIADVVCANDVEFFCNYIVLTFQRLIPFGKLKVYRSLAYNYWRRAHSSSSNETAIDDGDCAE